MNSSEQKQIYLLGRMLFRDAARVQNLINTEQLNVSSEASEFAAAAAAIRLSHGHISAQDFRDIYEKNFSNRIHSDEYKKVADILAAAS
ncbi:MAG: hypothetical protein ACJAVA_002494 [Flavobacteriaceae bacterium]|jgi:hypothetical protein